MNWNTLYITGNDNFWEEVNKKLSHSELNILPGYLEQQTEGRYQALYWLDPTIELRAFKEAITAKLIWKYRLHFFSEIEQAKSDTGTAKTDSEEFSPKENALIKAMRSQVKRTKKIKLDRFIAA